MYKCYEASERFLERALESIPLGSQTFSKSYVQFPKGASPLFLQRGEGCKVWDLDGHEYTDFVNGLLAVSLGYNDPDVNEAVFKQLQNGVTFSLAHPLETMVSEKLIETIPCAEMVRFGKNGSDVTSGAIRLARAFTNKDRIAVCGYHGWQDWYIGTTPRNLGVPKSTQELTHTFVYNDIDSLDRLFSAYPDQFAAVIMEPMNIEQPKSGFLESVKELAHHHGALLIFDEMITGFRFAIGGAQSYFNVIPDLATFGKGMANGYPLAALVGRKDIMQLMTEIFFSFTFGGETLSLAASYATINKIQSQPVIEKLFTLGTQLKEGIHQLIDKYSMEDFLSCVGHPSWSFLIFKDIEPYTSWDIKTLWIQEILARGVLSFGTHNLSYAHNEYDIDNLLKIYNEVFPLLREAIAQKNLHKLLRTEPLQPLFKVR
ncbi:TPA: aminotransferase class III-fold pyridoxal phosphate-dependent enzyme [Legionella pneumophila]|uniref:aminotransferase class III-fold pyridoxal phosphate-dependent enzyme n=1 Tax=Legionella pneumophila TaxID=446 RepID=UPI000481192F|nr:aminotransferase class III-fold pyridoxal phosphate-dependent enzyme [Legionella pneumophila]BCL64351.1 glutamate-1-semialdehyde 2,1-aminomutase [Legionella pneumophila serogroup 2]MCK1858147.1 aminotransferase class III-fold pyridoxal phosphate-dependent enzyme [Legionella pneumophila]RYW93368.1 aminotransferase class III-fold pyridoxal phosphate-dependent enzyme [Legionella pneumophila]STX98247.1 putative aminotransferase class-III [Legionella pneumophila]HAT1774447.1 aminotransferase cla